MDIWRFYQQINKLKSLQRTGWVERGVKDAENVAGHSFMTAVLCMLLAPKGIDRDKAIKMAIVHDFAESITGDIIIKDYWKEGGTMTREEKAGKERKAIKELISMLEKDKADETLGLWREFEANDTPEAKFVNNIDRMEPILQAIEYHKEKNHEKPLESFWDNKALSRIKDEKIKKLVLDIIEKA